MFILNLGINFCYYIYPPKSKIIALIKYAIPDTICNEYMRSNNLFLRIMPSLFISFKREINVNANKSQTLGTICQYKFPSQLLGPLSEMKANIKKEIRNNNAVYQNIKLYFSFFLLYTMYSIGNSIERIRAKGNANKGLYAL